MFDATVTASSFRGIRCGESSKKNARVIIVTLCHEYMPHPWRCQRFRWGIFKAYAELRVERFRLEISLLQTT